jgi:hypothetical protein
MYSCCFPDCSRRPTTCHLTPGRRLQVDTVKSDDAFLTTAGNSTTTTIPGMSLSPSSSKFSGWSARRAFGRVVSSSRSHAAVAPLDVMVRKQQQQPAPCYAKQSSSSSSCGSDRTTPSPPMALPLQLTRQSRRNMTDRSSTLTDPVAETLLAQEAAQQQQQHQPQPQYDERMQLKFWAAPSPVHVQPLPVLSRPTAIRPMMTTQR